MWDWQSGQREKFGIREREYGCERVQKHASVEKVGIRQMFKMYQANESEHKAWKTRIWLLFNYLKVDKTPPKSSDSNIIASILYYVDHRFYQRATSRKKTLVAVPFRRVEKKSSRICPMSNRIHAIKSERLFMKPKIFIRSLTSNFSSFRCQYYNFLTMSGFQFREITKVVNG